MIFRNLAEGGDAGIGGSQDGAGFGGGVFGDPIVDLTFVFNNDADFGDNFWP
jgi:hypothetical protein